MKEQIQSSGVTLLWNKAYYQKRINSEKTWTTACLETQLSRGENLLLFHGIQDWFQALTQCLTAIWNSSWGGGDLVSTSPHTKHAHDAQTYLQAYVCIKTYVQLSKSFCSVKSFLVLFCIIWIIYLYQTNIKNMIEKVLERDY